LKILEFFKKFLKKAPVTPLWHIPWQETHTSSVRARLLVYNAKEIRAKALKRRELWPKFQGRQKNTKFLHFFRTNFLKIPPFTPDPKATYHRVPHGKVEDDVKNFSPIGPRRKKIWP
jgi:hypothetical protein